MGLEWDRSGWRSLGEALCVCSVGWVSPGRKFSFRYVILRCFPRPLPSFPSFSHFSLHRFFLSTFLGWFWYFLL